MSRLYSTKTWQELSSAVRESPHNLILHAQRILFCVDNELSEQACSALQDLFTVLKHNGYDLRLRMFNLTSPTINESERSYFQQCLSNKQDDQPESRQYDGSVLNGES